ncbi:MAG: T9SS type A sorting domain-containing protein [Cyclobacteriaceae bacterium]|nr:T9SS type A sorting domain-containing protein [Cyclobacteriaceae bacterium]
MPNPTRGDIHICYGGNEEDDEDDDEEQVSASLRSQHGNLIFRASGDLSELTEQLTQVLQRSQPGVYILRLQREDEVRNLRIVVQR